MLKAWWGAFLDMLYPPRCPVCRCGVEKHGGWCSTCLARILAPRQVNLATRRLTALDACHIVCDYTGGVKELIHRLKFQHQEERAVYLEWLLQEWGPPAVFSAVDVVVPVPLSASRQAERGFNQNDLIFRRWAERCGWSWCDALDRVRATVPQWELELADRRKNIKGAFALTRQAVLEGRTVLLVDDIFTSGLTMDECAKVLRRGGASKVLGLALSGGGL